MRGYRESPSERAQRLEEDIATLKRAQEVMRSVGGPRTNPYLSGALAIARKHRDESVAWDDVCLLLEQLELSQ